MKIVDVIALVIENYICAPSPTGPKWLFIGPQATVFDADGEQKLTHFQSTNPLQGVEKSHLMRRDLRPHTRDALRCYKLQHASLLHRL